MRIVTWNCNGALRNKTTILRELKADVYVVQECENPESVQHPSSEYLSFCESHIWTGHNKNKGLGVFTISDLKPVKVEMNYNWRGRSLQWFIPFTVCRGHANTRFLAVWNHKADAKAFNYIGQSWLFLQNNKHYFKDCVVLGDFNSNSIWDSWDRWWNHSDFVNELELLGLKSVYHSTFREEQGHESEKTLFFRKNINMGYHIDYIFAPLSHIQNTKVFKIHSFDNWKDLSDHVPIEWEYSESGLEA